MNKLFLNTALLFLVLFTFNSCAELETYPVENQATTEPLVMDRIGAALGEYSIFVPENVDAEKYMASLSEQELVDKINTVKIYDFLAATDNLQTLLEDKPDFDVLTMEDVDKYAPRDADRFLTYEKQGLRGCTEINRFCNGSTMIIVKKCCPWSGAPSWLCKTRHYQIWNHINCTNPCSQINCPPNQYCSNGACHNYPSCSPPCPNGQICGGNNNCFWP